MKRLLLLSVICYLLFAGSVFYYLHYYYIHYPKDSSEYWQYGYKEAVSYIKENYEKYEKIIVSDVYGRAYGYLLFYLQYKPEKIQEEAGIQEIEGKGIYKVGKCEVGNIGRFLNSGLKNILLVGSPEEFPKNIKALKVIKDLNNQEIFKIVAK